MFCGIKKSGRKDLALLFSKYPAAVAGVFTTNQFKAAPILISEENIKGGICRAIVANAGSANCGTGEQGLKDAKEMVAETANALGIKSSEVLVTSTGSIGKFLPMKKIVKGIKKLAENLKEKNGREIADAILTTDTRPKEIALSYKGIIVGGVAKGSGMIHPNMATMHAFVTTDAKISKILLQRLLKEAVDKSFNLTTVDQCQSTNDCVFIMANGASGLEVNDSNVKEFKEALEKVCIYLAKEIVRDGEGATQIFEVKVTGARSEKEAGIAARAIAGSDLLKCAIYGKDNNWGRIFAAAGSTTAKINPNKIKANIKFGKKESLVTCDLGVGSYEASAWGCDLTEGYITINAKYHT